MGNMNFDYYYGIEAEQFSFYRVPRLLIKDERFKDLSSDAKLLYGLMLDRLALSTKNGWIDSENRVFIHYTLDNIMEDLGCAREKCAKVLAELDCKKGIGLIEKKRQGLGKPDIIYVKNFATLDAAEKAVNNPSDSVVSTEVRKSNFKKFDSQTSRSSEIELQEVRKSNLQKFDSQTSGSSEFKLAEVRDSNPSYNNISYTNMNYNNPSNQSDEEIGLDGLEDADTCISIIKENIEYDHHMKYDPHPDREMFGELFDIICEVVCVKHKAVKIGGDDYPYELVRSRFMKLTGEHLEYVIESMRNTTSKIANIKAYMITALYNAPSTINHYYRQEVQHDMSGSGYDRKIII